MTRGRIYFDPNKGEWVIIGPPDIAMRLKRIFPRMVQPQATELRIKETPEVANDLEWTLQRFPMQLDPEPAARLAERAKWFRDQQARLDRLMEAAPAPSQFALAKPLRDYQSVAARLYLEQGHLLLADEVGLGKTVSAIASFTDRRTLPALVVVKAHLPKQWVDEIKVFLPNAIVHVIKQTKEYKLPPADVFVISYSKLAAWWGILATRIKSVVYDEIQELRIQGSGKYEAARLLSGAVPFRLGLSATPIANYGGEAWSVFNLLARDALGTEAEFQREWCSCRGNGHWVVNYPDALGTYLRQMKLMVRRTRKDVGRLLPPIMRYVQEATFDEAAFAKGTSSADELAQIILTGTFLERGQAARQFDLELRQATGVAKAPFVAELVRMLVDSGERVLLGGWHRAVYAIWADRLRDLKPVFFTGHESTAQKEASKQTFIRGDSKVLVMSLRSGAGTNGLQDVSSVCVLGEMDWSPAVHHQFIGRLARDGQKASVQVFIPVAPVGSDPTMAAVLGIKEAQANGIVDLGVEKDLDFVETDPQRLKQLAIDYLKSRGRPIVSVAPEPVEIAS